MCSALSTALRVCQPLEPGWTWAGSLESTRLSGPKTEPDPESELCRRESATSVFLIEFVRFPVYLNLCAFLCLCQNAARSTCSFVVVSFVGLTVFDHIHSFLCPSSGKMLCFFDGYCLFVC